MTIFLLWPSYSFSQFDEFVKDYFDALEKRKAFVFYSQCGSKKNRDYLATSILEVDPKKGLLIEMNGKVVINLASLVITKSGISFEETHGGVYTMERVKKLIEEMSRKEFRLIVPFVRKKLEGVGTTTQCSNTPS